jgi:hypothetical protein
VLHVSSLFSAPQITLEKKSPIFHILTTERKFCFFQRKRWLFSRYNVFSFTHSIQIRWQKCNLLFLIFAF